MPRIYRPFTDHESDEIWGRMYLKLVGTIARSRTGLSTDFRLFYRWIHLKNMNKLLLFSNSRSIFVLL